MSVDQYQRTVNNLDKEIADLEKKKAAADKKAASEAKKAAGVSISKNASAATIKSKMRQIEGYTSSSQKAEAESAEQKAAKEAEAAKEAAKQESERYLRLLADFQNFRIRTEKEKSDIRSFAIEKFVGELLPVLDNFERALQMKTDDADSYAKGMELIFRQMTDAFEKAGVKEIPAEGEKFDPNVHNAVMTESSDELEDDMIGKVLQKGYTLNGRVIRPSMVSVIKK